MVLRLQIPLSSYGCSLGISLDYCRVLVGDCTSASVTYAAATAASNGQDNNRSTPGCDIERNNQHFSASLLLAIRVGIISVYPELSLKMIKAEKLYNILCCIDECPNSTSGSLGTLLHVNTLQKYVAYHYITRGQEIDIPIKSRFSYCWRRNIQVSKL